MKTRYETMLILPPAEEDKIDSTIEEVEEYLNKQDGEVTNVNKWGTRRLAYEIKNLKEGNYVILNFEIDGSKISSLHYYLKHNEDIIRYLVNKTDKKKK